ncbi:MAG: hypothetical protein WCH05_05575 [Chlorobiaceae bacterium]
MDWILARLMEPSTWQGIAAILTAAGVQIAPDLQQHIIATGVTVVGLISCIKKG